MEECTLLNDPSTRGRLRRLVVCDEAVKTLLVEDEPAQAHLLQETLKLARGVRFDTQWVESLEAAKAACAKGMFDVVLLDLRLGDSDGLSTLEKAIALAPGAAVVVLTGLDDEQMGIDALRRGAADYLVKCQVDHHTLVRSVRYAIERKRLDDERTRTLGAIQETAHALGLQEAGGQIDVEPLLMKLRQEVRRRVQAEMVLKESEQRFRTIVETFPGLIWIMPEDGKGGFSYLSDRVEGFFGYPRRMFLDGTISLEGLVHEDDWAKLTSAIQEAVAEHQPFLVEVRCRKADGGAMWIQNIGAGVYDGDRLKYIIGASLDVTERKVLEKRILDAGEQERRRVGADLHETLGQILTGVALLSKAQSHRLAGSKEAHAAQEITRLLNQAVSYTRSLARGLCPVALGGEGLISGLYEYAATISETYGMQCVVEAQDGLNLPSEAVNEHLYGIVMEAVHSAIRQGRATKIVIGLASRDGKLELTVRDDGKGVRNRKHHDETSGIEAMKYRAQAAGAVFKVKSVSDGGTVVTCTLPHGKGHR